MRRFPFAFALLAACAGTQESARVGDPANGPSRYRVGDFIVYRYDGAFTPAPVTLREEITGQEGNRLRIDVTATRGADVRRWIQIVTDTPENRKNNVIDALYEVAGGRFVRVSNEANRDVLRLYEWALLLPEGRAQDVQSQPCTRDLAGTRFRCTCTKGRNRWSGRDVTFEESECPDFLWTHGSGGFRDEATGEDVQRTDVLAFGRRKDAKPQSLEPGR